MVVTECADCTTFLSLVELRPARIDFGVESLVAPLASAAIGVFAADTRSFSHSADRCVTLAFSAFVVKAAGFTHRG